MFWQCFITFFISTLNASKVILSFIIWIADCTEKPSERMTNLWTVRFLNRIRSDFPHSPGVEWVRTLRSWWRPLQYVTEAERRWSRLKRSSRVCWASRRSRWTSRRSGGRRLGVVVDSRRANGEEDRDEVGTRSSSRQWWPGCDNEAITQSQRGRISDVKASHGCIVLPVNQSINQSIKNF